MKRLFSLLAIAIIAALGVATAAAPQGGNNPPVCVLAPLSTVECQGASTSIMLDASHSYDPDGDPITFDWASCPGSTLDNPTSPTPVLTIDTSSSCLVTCGVRLIVSDGTALGYCRTFVMVIESGDFCETNSKPAAIEMRYTGESCSATNHHQAAGSVTCAGDPMGADPVHIVVTNANGNVTTYFDGMVPKGGLFTIDGSNGPGNSGVPANSLVMIFDTSGGHLQTVRFHTSCSQPLIIGDQFGSVVLTGVTAKSSE